MRIITNIASYIKESNINTGANIQSSLEKISTGLTINAASDDPSGLSIADTLRTHATGLNQSISNGNSAISLVQVAEKSMGEQSTLLDVMKQKLLQLSTSTTSLEGAKSIAKDISKLTEQINAVANQTNYNGQYLLQKDHNDSSGTNELYFQVGTSIDDNIRLTGGLQSNTTGLNLDLLVTHANNNWNNATTAQSAQSDGRTFLLSIDNALDTINSYRTDVGAVQNQLESKIRTLIPQLTNTKISESVLRDTDFAQESTSYSKQNIIMQAGTYALSQANSSQESVVRLLQ